MKSSAAKPARNMRKLGRPRKQGGPGSRSLILEAALELFSSQGYEPTSIKQITDKLGFSDSALYGHFASKADIRTELFTNFGPGARLLEWSALDLAGAFDHPKEFVKDVLHRLVERWMDPRERQFFRFMLMESLRTDQEPILKFGEVQAELRKHLRKIAQKLMDRGRLLRLDPDWLVGQFVAPIITLRLDVAFEIEAPVTHALVARLDQHVDLFFVTFGASRI